MKIMKRSLSVLLSVLMIVSLFGVVSFNVSAVTSGITGDCSWVLDDDGTLIISGEGCMGDTYLWDCSKIVTVIINEGVTNIGNYAFASCNNLISISFAESVTSIGSSAFAYCTKLTDVILPSQMLSLGSYSFYGCEHLENIYIPKEVTSIGQDSFSNCKRLTSISLPSKITSIQGELFRFSENLESVTISSKVATIEPDAFFGCNSLNNVYYLGESEKWDQIRISNGNDQLNVANRHYLSESGVTGECNWYYFSNTGSLVVSGNGRIGEYGDLLDVPWNSIRDQIKTINIQYGVTSIGSCSFLLCESLTGVTLPNSVTSICDRSFKFCTSLTSLTIPDSVVSIGDDAFEDCSSLVNIRIPDNVKNIGDYAFCECTNLTSITVGKGVTSIGNGAFVACSNLKSIVVDNDNSYYSSIDGNLYNKDKTEFVQYAIGKTDTSYTIPDSITSIGNGAFYGCKSITSVTIPDSVKSINENAFFSCANLKNVYYLGTVESWNNISIGQYNTVLTNATIHYLDNEKPTCSITSTNNIASSQIATLSLSDNVGIAGYYWGTNSSYSSNSYTSTSSTSVTKTISSSGTYYLTAKDTSGNISDTKSITFYSLNLNANGGTLASGTPSPVLTESGNSFTPDTPTRSGFEFVGWNTSSTATTGSKTITPASNDRTYYAIWKDVTKPTCSITSTKNIASSQTATLLLSDNVGIAGYYWGQNPNYKNNKYVATSQNTVETIVSEEGYYYLTAVDTNGNISNTYNTVFYEIKLNADGGSCTPNSIIAKNGDTIKLPIPQKENYEFEGWVYNDGSNDKTRYEITAVSFNTILKAKWSDKTEPTCSISSTNNLASSQTVTLSLSDNVGIAGYYWGIDSNYNNNDYTATQSSGVTKTITAYGTYYLTAKDTSGNVSETKSITFYGSNLNANRGTLASGTPTFVLTANGYSFVPATPTRDGFEFVGWNTSSTSITGSKTVTPASNITYYAVWKDITKPTCSIRSTNNLASAQIVEMALEDNVGIAGYYWGSDSNYINNTYSSFSSSDTSVNLGYDDFSSTGTYYLTAKDTSGNVSETRSITFYKTTLNPNDGVLASGTPSTVLTASGNSFTPNNPTKSNHRFIGWSTLSSATTGSSTITPLANATYYAIWEKINESTTPSSETEPTSPSSSETNPTNPTEPTQPSSETDPGTEATEPTATKTTVTASIDESTIYVGNTTQIRASIKNGIGKTTFTSSNTKVATVSSNGVVTGIGKGSAIITVTNNGVSANVSINVLSNVTIPTETVQTTVNASISKTKIYVGETTLVSVSLTNGQGETSFKSNNTKVATVASNGTVTGKRAGKAIITVTNNGVQDSVTVTVLANTPQKQTITAKSYTKTYGAKRFSLGAKTSGNGKLSYKTSNKKVVSVSSKGKVTIKGCGKATITIKAAATSKYKAATKKISITVKPGKVKLTSRKIYTENGIHKVKQKFVQQNNCDGYELHVSLNSSFSPFVNYKYAKTRKDFIITSKTSGVKYYARFRAYKKIGKKTYYGKWTKVSFKI